MQFKDKNIEQIKITVLVEDTKNENLPSAHGLSLYIETPENKILFDMGPNELFWENAEFLGIGLNTVDTAVISHGHYDHGGGLSTFLDKNKNGKVYIRENAFGDYYSTSQGKARYIGLDKKLKTNDRLILTAPGITQISSNLTLFSSVESKELCPNSNNVLWKMTEHGLVNDNFEHEQNLIIKSGNRYILVGGCAHNGIINIEKKHRKSWVPLRISLYQAFICPYREAVRASRPTLYKKRLTVSEKAKLYVIHVIAREALHMNY